MSVAILIPVLNRPGNVAPLLASIERTTPRPFDVLFICDPDDVDEHQAVADAGAHAIFPGGRYAAKIRAGVAATSDPLVFIGADDLVFTHGWLQAAVRRITAGALVVGVNDTIRRRRRPAHATHFLITREYAQRPTIDGAPGPLSAEYSHSFVDDELIATATYRGVYAYAPDAVVEHRHWINRGAPDDETYRRGRARFEEDRAIFNTRSVLWT